MSKATPNASQSAKPRVYSYIRFSRPEQLKGDSLRRQMDLSKRWCEKNGYVLDEIFKLHDLGLSAFRGKNAAVGKLAAFIDAVRAGRVEKGSILLMESLDRLSREQVTKAVRLFLEILELGIVIVTLEPEEWFDYAKLDMIQFVIAIVIMGRGNEESKTKRERVIAARDTARRRAREEGRILTKQCPAWLTVKDGKFVLVPEAAETIGRIFELKLRGLGKTAIAQALRKEATWFPPPSKHGKRAGGKWRESYIQKILANQAVIGVYQPYTRRDDGKREPVDEPIQDYYPTIVRPDVFYAAQEQLNKNKGKGGRTGKASNLFTHLAKCAYCGGAMHFVDKGPPPKGGQYLVCENARLGKKDPAGKPVCTRHSIKYAECEQTILENCHRLRPEEILPNPDEQRQQCKSLQTRITGREGELQAVEAQLENYAKRVGSAPTDAIVERIYSAMAVLENRKKELETQLRSDRSALVSAEQTRRSFSVWKADLEFLREAMSDDVSVRIRLQHHLRDWINKVEVFSVGFKKNYDPSADGELPKLSRGPNGRLKVSRTPPQSTEDIGEYIDAVLDHADSKPLRRKERLAFVDYVMKQRMSKNGRFLRVHFRTGAIADVVPPGSLASGAKWVKDSEGNRSWRSIRPDLDQLWREFRAESGRVPLPKRKRKIQSSH
jgi:DNA invertase Pin-like site-specific DNA recombinase